jgi:NADH dehydrogenase [ubiquinone] 1 alpha subcomplex assembly factor 5
MSHTAPTAEPHLPFDRALLRRRRERAAQQAGADADFLFEEAGRRLAERLLDVRRDFASVLELGARRGALQHYLPPAGSDNERWHVALESAHGFAGGLQNAVVADEEALPFAEASFDLVLANLSLHHVNDLPGLLWQVQRVLRPDGLFLGVMLGGESLYELRACLVEAETVLSGGAYPRLSPLADLRQAAALLQRAGFALPVADHERLTVRYGEPLRLLSDLRAMAETNIRTDRSRKPLRRDVLMHALALYRERFGGADGRVPASFDMIFLTGWRPDASQPKPLRPGSATAKLAEALGGTEHPTDDMVAPPTGTRHSDDAE